MANPAETHPFESLEQGWCRGRHIFAIRLARSERSLCGDKLVLSAMGVCQEQVPSLAQDSWYQRSDRANDQVARSCPNHRCLSEPSGTPRTFLRACVSARSELMRAASDSDHVSSASQILGTRYSSLPEPPGCA